MTGRATDLSARLNLLCPPYPALPGSRRTDRPGLRRDGGPRMAIAQVAIEPSSVFVQATSGTQASERWSQAKGDFPLDLADGREIAVLRVTLAFPDATPAVLGQGIVWPVEGTA